MCQEKQGIQEFCPGREEGEMRDQMKGWMERGEKGTWAQGMLAHQRSGSPAKLGCWREVLQGTARRSPPADGCG